ncbi:hypothetical protein E4T39_01976 [Aureobasidium subglaciale]|nr:hypothetical protein E4T39_01976 [Aureobasidium subglaciale]
MDANQNENPNKKTYHKKATGTALETVERHSDDHELKLFGSCFCPFVQRVWISLELKRLDYQYIELAKGVRVDQSIGVLLSKVTYLDIHIATPSAIQTGTSE